MRAGRKYYDIAVLVAGDEDFVPLVEAVQSEGRRVPRLVGAVDSYVDISHCLAEPARSSVSRITAPRPRSA